MEVGFNYPWIANRDGYSFGPRSNLDVSKGAEPNAYFEITLPGNLATLKKMRVTVVRMFILCNGFNYGLTPSAPSATNGWRWSFLPPEFFDDPRPTPDPDGKVRKFADHYSQMLKCFKDAGLKIIPSLISYEALLNPSATPNPISGQLGAGRGDIVDHPLARQNFIKYMVQGFIDLSTPYKDQILAIEVINEPIWNMRTFKPDRKPGHVITEQAMSDFLIECCTKIEDANFDSTVGHRFYEDCKKYPTGTLAQFHYYPEDLSSGLVGHAVAGATEKLLSDSFGIIDLGKKESVPLAEKATHYVAQHIYNPDPDILPEASTALAEVRLAQKKIRPNWTKDVKNIFVGEFGSSLRDGDPLTEKGQGASWPELHGSDQSVDLIIDSRLRWLQRKSYPLAMVWPNAKSNDSDELVMRRVSSGNVLGKMSADRLYSLCRFTGGSFR